MSATEQCNNFKIGRNIRKWRTLKDLKQKDFAKLLGISVSTLSNYENDKSNISLAKIQKIATTLKITLNQLTKDPYDLL